MSPIASSEETNKIIDENPTGFKFWMKWLLPIFVSLIMFCNHYVRDCPGALEKPIETELSFTPQDYSVLNSLYFFPNIISPLIAGIFIDKLGGIVKCFYLSLIIASIGHLFFAMGASIESKGVMYLGKGLSGSMYEIVDAVMPIIYLSPLFKNDFQIAVSFAQIFLRMGSVVNFLVSPLIYRAYGLTTALWVASLVGTSSILLLIAARYAEYYWLASPPSTSTTASSSSQLTAVSNERSLRNDEENNILLPPSSSDSIIPLHDPLPQSREIDSSSHYYQREGETDSSAATNHISSSSLPSSDTFSSLKDLWFSFLSLTQFHQFSAQFYFYLLAGSFLYGSIVPFWFYGSKYLQDTFALAIERADWIMTLPEGMVVITGFPFGLFITRFQPTLKSKLIGLSLALLFMSISFWILIYSAQWNLQQQASLSLDSSSSRSAPQNLCLFAVTLLGTAFSCSCGLFWGIVNEVVNPQFFNQGNGILSCAVNILPAILPPLFSRIALSTASRHSTIIILAIEACLGSICAFLAAFPSFLTAFVYSSTVASLTSYRNGNRYESIPQDSIQ